MALMTVLRVYNCCNLLPLANRRVLQKAVLMNMGAFAVLLLLLSSTYTCTAGTDQNLIVETKSGKVKINHLIPPYHHFVYTCTLYIKGAGKVQWRWKLKS